MLQILTLGGFVTYAIGYLIVGEFLGSFHLGPGSLLRTRYLTAGLSFLVVLLPWGLVVAVLGVWLAECCHRRWVQGRVGSLVFSVALFSVAATALWLTGPLQVWLDGPEMPRQWRYVAFAVGVGFSGGVLVGWVRTVVRAHPHYLVLSLIAIAGLYWLGLSSSWYAKNVFGTVGSEIGGGDPSVAYLFVTEQGKQALEMAGEGVVAREVRCADGTKLYSTTLVGLIDEDEDTYYFVVGELALADPADWPPAQHAEAWYGMGPWGDRVHQDAGRRIACVRLAKSTVASMVFVPNLTQKEVLEGLAREMGRELGRVLKNPVDSRKPTGKSHRGSSGEPKAVE